MQNLKTSETTELDLELFHIQSQNYFDLPANLTVINIGKPNEQTPPDIDVSELPNGDIASRIHAQIRIKPGLYILEDMGSGNGTFLNDIKLVPRTPNILNTGDRIDLGQGNKITFIFQHKQIRSIPVTGSITNIQTPISNRRITNKVNQRSKFIGLALMVAAIAILTGSINVGIAFHLPAVIVCMVGVYLLLRQDINKNLGWLFIAIGIGLIVFTGYAFANVNLLVFIAASTLFICGYQLFDSGAIFGYNLRSLRNLIKK